MAVDQKSEEDRVFGNPENLIVSDTLKDILEMQRAADSDSPLDKLDSGNINVRLLWKDGFVAGDIMSFDVNSSIVKISLVMRRFGALIILNNSIDSQVEIEMSDGMYEEKIIGKITDVSLFRDKDTPDDKVILGFSIAVE